MLASPDSIGEENVGLGVYFKSLEFFFLITVIMTVFGMYPLIDSTLAEDYVSNRDVQVKLYNQTGDSSPTISATKPCKWTSDKDGDETIDTFAGEILPTLGSYCSSEISSKFACPSICTVEMTEEEYINNCVTNVSRSALGSSNDLQRAINCTVHHSSQYTPIASSPPFIDACQCDRFEFQTSGNDVPPGVWILILFAHIAYLIWLRVFRSAAVCPIHLLLIVNLISFCWRDLETCSVGDFPAHRVLYERATNKMDAQSVTASDYTIYVKRCGRGSEYVSYQREQIAKHFAHYGEVRFFRVKCFSCYAVEILSTYFATDASLTPALCWRWWWSGVLGVYPDQYK